LLLNFKVNNVEIFQLKLSPAKVVRCKIGCALICWSKIGINPQGWVLTDNQQVTNQPNGSWDSFVHFLPKNNHEN